MSETKQQKKVAIVVSHTHWDRAWYLTFQQFRHRMVRMIDRLIPLLQQNPDYHSFTLDGQTILLDDYLEIKPYNQNILKQLISSGKMVVGPWYILPDLFLVSGESVIRNLQIGLQTARNYGASMQEGYVPDPFGHFAQLPQVLHKFGIDSFIFMRGLDAESKQKAGSIFNWRSPDGSQVLTTYLADGYFNGAALGYPDQYGRFDGLTPDRELASKRLHEAVEKLKNLQKESVFLINNGFDHMPEQPELPRLLAEINQHANGTGFRHGTFRDFFEAVRKENHPHEIVEGDLLGNADHPILSSVFSTRIYLKQQNHRAQSLLERHTEPLLLWGRFHTNRPDPSDFLGYAWKLLLQNHPHDDICGCSTDGVHEDDEVRFRQVSELAESLIVEQLESMLEQGLQPPGATGTQSADLFVYNPNPWPVTRRIRTSILFANPGAEKGERTPLRKLMACGANAEQVPVTIISSDPHSIRNNFLETSWGRRYEVALSATIPAGGYHILHLYETDEIPAEPAKADYFRCETGGSVLTGDAGGYRLTIGATGTELRNFIDFEFEHDNGDTYTFGPVPDQQTVTARLTAVEPDPHDPHLLVLRHELDVPVGLNSAERTTLRLQTVLQLQHDGALAVSVQYTNTCSDNRLRIILPAALHTNQALADGHFRLAERQTIAFQTPETDPDRYQAYPGELEYRTRHMNDFLLLDDTRQRTWIATRGLHEFELLQNDEGARVAVTVNRSVGLLSTGNGRIRRVQAGPAIRVPGAQCHRTITADLALGMVPASQKEQAVQQARSFAHPVWVREMPYLPHLKTTGHVPRAASIVTIDNPMVALSSFRLHPDGETAVLRVYNLNGNVESTTVRCDIPAHNWAASDLNERWPESGIHTCDKPGQFELTLNPHEIQTILLRTQDTR